MGGSYLASRVGGLNAHARPWVQRRCELCVDVLSAVQTEAHFWVGCPALWAPRDRLLSEVDALYPGFAGRHGQLRTPEARDQGSLPMGQPPITGRFFSHARGYRSETKRRGAWAPSIPTQFDVLLKKIGLTYVLSAFLIA
jgi:hypothetical protein